MTAINLPPLCPVCGGNTTLKEIHRAARAGKFTCFFRCVDCATEYPRSVEADEAAAVTLGQSPATNADRDPAT